MGRLILGCVLAIFLISACSSDDKTDPVVPIDLPPLRDRPADIVLLADHGHPLGDHEIMAKFGDNLYSELIRIPLLIRLPDQSLTGYHDALVQGVDLMPTLFDILGFDDNLRFDG